MRVLTCLAVVVFAAVLTACGNPLALLPASINNTVDTVEMYSVNGTALNKPSAYILAQRQPVKLGVDGTLYNFDFVYRLTPAGPEFAPFAAVAANNDTTVTSGKSAFQVTTTAFDAITVAEQTGYEPNKPLKLEVGQVMYVRSAIPNGCYLSIPYYAKLEVLSFDSTAKSVKFRILVDINCGYRGLAPGLPTK
jgi:hypothetical protein